MKRYLIRIKMFNKTEISILVDSDSIDSVRGYLEQEFINNSQPMLAVHDVHNTFHMINKSKIHQIIVTEIPNIFKEETMVLVDVQKSSQEEYGNYS